MDGIQIVLLIIIVLALIAIYYSSTYNKIKTEILKINSSESEIDTLLRNKYDLIAKVIVEINQPDDKNLKISVISTGSNSINLGKETSIMFYTLPNLNTDDELNLYSPIIKLTYKNISFLFTGDAELKNEEFLIKNEINLRSHILKIGHHGSSSSTCEAFLNSVNPKVAIISVGSNNKYGHPAASTLNLLKNYHIKVYRTDLLGNIILKSDGSSFSVLYQWKNER